MILREIIKGVIEQVIEEACRPEKIRTMIEESIDSELNVEEEAADIVRAKVANDVNFSDAIEDAVNCIDDQIEDDIAKAVKEKVETALADLDITSIVTEAVEEKLGR